MLNKKRFSLIKQKIPSNWKWYISTHSEEKLLDYKTFFVLKNSWFHKIDVFQAYKVCLKPSILFWMYWEPVLCFDVTWHLIREDLIVHSCTDILIYRVAQLTMRYCWVSVYTVELLYLPQDVLEKYCITHFYQYHGNPFLTFCDFNTKITTDIMWTWLRRMHWDSWW